MTRPPRRQPSRLQGKTPDGRRLSLKWAEKGSLGEGFCLGHLDPLAAKVGVEIESLRGWYDDCLRLGMVTVYTNYQNHQADAPSRERFRESVEAAADLIKRDLEPVRRTDPAKALAMENARFTEKLRRLATQEDGRRQARLATSTRHLLFLQVRSGELADYWPRFTALTGSEQDRNLNLRSMYVLAETAEEFGYEQWLAHVAMNEYEYGSYLMSAGKTFRPHPWERAQ